MDVLLSAEGIFVWPPRDRTISAEEDLRGWAHEMVLAYTTEPRVSLMKALTTATSDDPSVGARVHERFSKPAISQLIAIFQEAVPDAGDRAVELAALMFTGAFVQGTTMLHVDITDEFAEGALDLALLALRASGESGDWS